MDRLCRQWQTALQYFVLLSASLLLSGCATSTHTMVASKPHTICLQQKTQTHQAWLNSIHSFNASGSIVIQDEQGKKQRAYFVWKQHLNDFDIMLSGPLGIHPVHLNGNEHAFTIETSKKKQTIKTPHHTLTFNGRTIPISPDWIKGALLPKATANINEKGYIESMISGALTFNYHHKCNQGFWLPKSIELLEAQETIGILTIRRWQIG